MATLVEINSASVRSATPQVVTAMCEIDFGAGPETVPYTVRTDRDPETEIEVAIRAALDDGSLVPTTEVVDLAPLKAAKIAAAWAEQEQRLVAHVVNVPISGTLQPFGCDPVSRENIMGICGLIAQEMAGLQPAGSVPNPRGFTPKGQSAPVMVTHAEFALIGAYMAGAKDAHFIAYAAHKAAIHELTTAEAVANYDITTGWPV